MAYRIEGLAPEAFESLFGMSDGELAGARRDAGDRGRAAAFPAGSRSRTPSRARS